MALAVPLSRFTSQVGGGSAFFVRHRGHALSFMSYIVDDIAESERIEDLASAFRAACRIGSQEIHDVGLFAVGHRPSFRFGQQPLIFVECYHS